jgi:sulfur carrier protein
MTSPDSQGSDCRSIRVIVNGERRELPPRATVFNVVELLAGDGGGSRTTAGRGVAVAVDGEVVPRDDWTSTGLREGARVEVLAAIQGGAR